MEILIIKLGAIGDVIRTTSILPGLKSKYDDCKIDWITKDESQDILKNNNKVDDKGRKNELTNALTISLNIIANKIDRGFNFDIRVEPLSEPEDSEKRKKGDRDKLSLINRIEENTKAIEFISTSGKPILKLKESK